MTTAHDIDPRQLVEDRLTGASQDLLRELLTLFIHALMGAEADVLCGAGYGQRTNSRNGYRHRDFDTPASEPSTSRSKNCGPAATFRIGCSNATSVPNVP